jgi:RNA polymerase sigma factor CnrH
LADFREVNLDIALTNLAARLAEVLELPIEVIQAYEKPLKPASYRATQKIVCKVSDTERPAHYATLKAVADIPAAEKVASSKTDENELYAQWRDAAVEKKPELEKKLFNKLVDHSNGVIWQMMHERDPELEALARDIASDAVKNLSLGRFSERSKFSTYVQGIAKNKINEEMERRIVRRNRFYVSKNPEEDIELADSNAKDAFERVEEGLDLAPLERLVQALPKKDHVLLDCVLNGMTMTEAAEKLGDTEDAAESRLRRLKTRLKKKIREKGDGKRPLRATN